MYKNAKLVWTSSFENSDDKFKQERREHAVEIWYAQRVIGRGKMSKIGETTHFKAILSKKLVSNKMVAIGAAKTIM